ncbi:hypothetical protein HpBT349_14080 [Helicobacter pylori]
MITLFYPYCSLLTIQLAVRSGSERHYTTKELEAYLEHLERFGFLIYGVAGKKTAKNEWIELAFKAIQAYRFWGDKITIEELPTLEKNFFNRQGIALWNCLKRVSILKRMLKNGINGARR